MQPDELHGNMKANQNGILLHTNSPGRLADPLATDLNDKDEYWNTPEFECATGMDDFTNVNGSEIKRSHPQLRSEFFKKETDFYTDKNVTEYELPELMICYKESSGYHVVKDICVDEGMHSEENNLIEMSKEDKCDDIVKGSLGTESFMQDRLRSLSGEECGLNAANECGTHDSDEKGIHTEPNGLELEYENGDKGKGNNGVSERNTDTKSILVDGPQSSTVKDCDVSDEFGMQESSDDSDEIAFPGCGPTLNTDQDVVQTVEESVPTIDRLMYDASAEESDSNSMSSGKTFRPQTSLKCLLNSSEFGTSDADNDDDDDDEQQPHQIPVGDTTEIPDSLSDSEEVSISGQVSDKSEVETGINDLKLDMEKAAVISEEETFQDDNDQPIEEGNSRNLTKASQEQYSVGETSFSVPGPIEGLPTYAGLTHEDETSDTASLARLVQPGNGESSFSMVGPVSGRITYSGPIPFSGSISLRSESSTTSTRSFAFPVLQNEWNSSPARMAKAERRRFHEHRGWRKGLLCCKFK